MATMCTGMDRPQQMERCYPLNFSSLLSPQFCIQSPLAGRLCPALRQKLPLL